MKRGGDDSEGVKRQGVRRGSEERWWRVEKSQNLREIVHSSDRNKKNSFKQHLSSFSPFYTLFPILPFFTMWFHRFLINLPFFDFKQAGLDVDIDDFHIFEWGLVGPRTAPEGPTAAWGFYGVIGVSYDEKRKIRKTRKMRKLRKLRKLRKIRKMNNILGRESIEVMW